MKIVIVNCIIVFALFMGCIVAVYEHSPISASQESLLWLRVEDCKPAMDRLGEMDTQLFISERDKQKVLRINLDCLKTRVLNKGK